MSGILKISDAASIAMHIMAYLASKQDSYVSTSDAAKAIRVSEHHLAKVRQRLTKVGLLKSERGPSGGFQLAKSPSKITLLDIYEAIEGPLTKSKCILGKPTCGRKTCIFGGLIESINNQAKEYFSKTTLDKLSLLELEKASK